VADAAPPPERWFESEPYLHGIELFNQRKFWESHEAWEEIWLVTDGIQSEFLQGLIQSAAALLKYERNEFAPALRLYNTAKGRLDLCPDDYMGLNVRAFQAAMATCFESILDGCNLPIDPQKIPIIQTARSEQ
jgi:predicted metal-dependent hydrolase